MDGATEIRSDGAVELEAAPRDVRHALREGTRLEHERVDERFSRLDLADRRDYAAFLLAHARVLPTIETCLEAGGIERVLPDWAARRRAEFLHSDLDDLDLRRPDGIAPTPIEGRGALLGAAYVLEGSRLGGRLLAARVGAELPRAFLTQGEGDGLWGSFVHRLRAHDLDGAVSAQAVASARAVFSFYERAAAEATAS